MVKFGVFLMGLGVASFMAFSLMGSSLDEAGCLHEPFALLPLGYLLLLAGACIGIAGVIRARRRPRPASTD
ncbi:DUF3955 domain-containing protein [Aeromonas veronii]|uniref:DUF3955 domain-containing protein n=1 Tax=Aeromonas veronii TaxID=654 RepID=UPI0032EB5693